MGESSSSADGKESSLLVNCNARLPDGSVLRFHVGKERFHCAELLFRPELHSSADHGTRVSSIVLCIFLHSFLLRGPFKISHYLTQPNLTITPPAGTPSSIVDTILESVAAVEDPEVKGDMVANVCLAGQTTRLPGFTERLEAELHARLAPPLAKRLCMHALERPREQQGAGAAIPEEEEEEDETLSPPSAAFCAAPAKAFGSAVAQAAAKTAGRALVGNAEAWWDTADWADGRDVEELVADWKFGDGV